MSTATMTEADLCAAFIAEATKPPTRPGFSAWTAYPETEGFDILLVRASDGAQVGIEAKLALNPKVVSQALPESMRSRTALVGPDYRATLIPVGKCGADLAAICAALGLVVIQYCGHRGGEYYGPNSYGPVFRPDLPFETTSGYGSDAWPEWAPLTRCPIPDYVPDVVAGLSAPVALTVWKVKAIKLSVLLEERPITRADLKHLDLSPTMWVGPHGWLDRAGGGWVRGPRTPDFQRQHPVNYGQIAADKAKWMPRPDKGLFDMGGAA